VNSYKDDECPAHRAPLQPLMDSVSCLAIQGFGNSLNIPSSVLAKPPNARHHRSGDPAGIIAQAPVCRFGACASQAGLRIEIQFCGHMSLFPVLIHEWQKASCRNSLKHGRGTSRKDGLVLRPRPFTRESKVAAVKTKARFARWGPACNIEQSIRDLESKRRRQRDAVDHQDVKSLCRISRLVSAVFHPWLQD
jgi:hypothetical protein